jgi:hypothetical protein
MTVDIRVIRVIKVVRVIRVISNWGYLSQGHPYDSRPSFFLHKTILLRNCEFVVEYSDKRE